MAVEEVALAKVVSQHSLSLIVCSLLLAPCSVLLCCNQLSNPQYGLFAGNARRFPVIATSICLSLYLPLFGSHFFVEVFSDNSALGVNFLLFSRESQAEPN